MFTKLPNNTKIYALSAANPSESSWGYYCSPDDVVQGKHIGSCLGDLFSINFLENTESINVDTVTLSAQFQVIQKLTTKSHVMQWGDLSFQDDFIGDYVSSKSGEFKMINLRKLPIKITDNKRSV
jgi:legumain